MLFKKKNEVDYSKLHTIFEEHLRKARNNEQLEQINTSMGNEQLDLIISKLNELTAITQLHQSRLEARLDNLQTVGKSSFREIQLCNPDVFSSENEVYISSEMIHMLGYPKEHCLNSMQELASLVPSEHQSLVTERLTGHLQDPSGRTPFDFKHLMKFGDGKFVGYIRLVRRRVTRMEIQQVCSLQYVILMKKSAIINN